MADWKITKDHLAAEFGSQSAVGVGSAGAENRPAASLTEKFKIYDDDGNLYYEGVSDDSDSEEAFAPLDDFATANDGATRIDYYRAESGRYEML